MSYWGYVMETLLNEDRDSEVRRLRQRRRLKREREQAVLAAAADALPKDLQTSPRRERRPLDAGQIGHVGRRA